MRVHWLPILLSALALDLAIAAPTARVVRVPVTVTDPLNRVVNGLDPGAIHIYEDKVEQKVSVKRDIVPLSVGIIFDTSGSMSGKLEPAQGALSGFFRAISNDPDNEAFLIEFNDRPAVVQGFTHDLKSIEQQAAESRSKGKTALFDAIYLGLDEMKKAKNSRKVLIVITDGQNTSSRYSGAEVAHLEKESDVEVFAIVDIDFGSLRLLTEPTGGMTLEGNLPDAGSKIAISLLNQYVVSYSPTNQAHDGKFRRISVRLNPGPGAPQMKAFWKSGYYAPTQ